MSQSSESTLRSDVFASVKTTIIFLVLTGLVFPLVLVGISEVAMKQPAEGSILEQNGTVVGSTLVGQPFSDPIHFQSRPFGVSNWGPNNPALIQNVSEQVAYQQALNPSMGLVPIDLVTQSGSGTDPHISVMSAFLQIPRIANLTGIPQSTLASLVNQYTENPTAGIFGASRVEVLQLNLALDGLMNTTTLQSAQANATALNAVALNATTKNATTGK
ncbi:MAG: potassium-transporting ATPase subunit C [Halobacteriota archaeon]